MLNKFLYTLLYLLLLPFCAFAEPGELRYDFNMLGADPAIKLTGNEAGDTKYWIKLTQDGNSTDDDLLQLGDGDTPGTSPLVTINTDGDVGIGTTSPSNKLHVQGTAAGTAGIYLNDAAPGTTTATIYNSGGNLYWAGVNLTGGGSLPGGTEGQMLYNNAGAWTATSGIFYDDTNGYVGIADTDPDATLEVVDDFYVSSAAANDGDLFKVTSDGYVLKQTNPAFLAYNSATDTNVTGDGTTVTVEFNTEVFDQGSDFNNTTDTFTAPITGKYFLSALVTFDDLDNDTWDNTTTEIVTSNSTYRNYRVADISASYYDSDKTTLLLMVLADMDASDTAYVTVTISGATKNVDIIGSVVRSTYFSGWLAN